MPLPAFDGEGDINQDRLNVLTHKISRISSSEYRVAELRLSASTDLWRF